MGQIMTAPRQLGWVHPTSPSRVRIRAANLPTCLMAVQAKRRSAIATIEACSPAPGADGDARECGSQQLAISHSAACERAASHEPCRRRADYC
jgi:hypothetical protein